MVSTKPCSNAFLPFDHKFNEYLENLAFFLALADRFSECLGNLAFFLEIFSVFLGRAVFLDGSADTDIGFPGSVLSEASNAVSGRQ